MVALPPLEAVEEKASQAALRKMAAGNDEFGGQTDTIDGPSFDYNRARRLSSAAQGKAVRSRSKMMNVVFKMVNMILNDGFCTSI